MNSCERCSQMREQIQDLENSYHDLLFERVFETNTNSAVLPGTPQKARTSNLSMVLPAVRQLNDAMAAEGDAETSVFTWDDVVAVVKKASRVLKQDKRNDSEAKTDDDVMVLDHTENVVPAIDNKTTKEAKNKLKHVSEYIDLMSARIEQLESENRKLNGKADVGKLAQKLQNATKTVNVMSSVLAYQLSVSDPEHKLNAGAMEELQKVSAFLSQSSEVFDEIKESMEKLTKKSKERGKIVDLMQKYSDSVELANKYKSETELYMEQNKQLMQEIQEAYEIVKKALPSTEFENPQNLTVMLNAYMQANNHLLNDFIKRENTLMEQLSKANESPASQAKIDLLKETNEELKKQLAEAHALRGKSEEERVTGLASLAETIDTLNNRLNDAIGAREIALVEKDKLEAELETLSKTVEDQKMTLKQVQELMVKTKATLEAIERENQVLKVKVKENQEQKEDKEELLKIKNLNDELASELEHREADLAEVKEFAETLNEDIIVLKQELEKRRTSEAEVQRRFMRLHKEHQDLVARNDQLEYLLQQTQSESLRRTSERFSLTSTASSIDRPQLAKRSRPKVSEDSSGLNTQKIGGEEEELNSVKRRGMNELLEKHQDVKRQKSSFSAERRLSEVFSESCESNADKYRRASAPLSIQRVADENSVNNSLNSKNKSPVVVSFSGFRDDCPDFTVQVKEEVAGKLRTLGAVVRLDGDFEDKITHVITPPGSKTLKCFAASLTSKWLITDLNWISDSYKAGYLLPEKEYGYKNTCRPFNNKSVYFAESFIKDCKNGKQARIDNARNLIEFLGGGKVVSRLAEADFALRGNDDKTKYSSVSAYSWSQFLELIPLPPQKVIK